MASHDLRDVFNLPADHAAAGRPSKKQKTSAPRPNLKGLAREVQNLGGDNPIAIVPEVSVFKKRRLASRKPAERWELRPFKNSARADDGGLILRHWRRKADESGPPVPPLPPALDADSGTRDANASPLEDGSQGPAREGDSGSGGGGGGALEDSAFAKFNVQVAVPQYNDDQYMTNLQNADWTKEETDYLLELARDFDLRWPIVWDRYEYVPKAPSQQQEQESLDSSTAVIPAPKARSLEDLKARYYEVAARMMAVQKPAQYMTRPEFELYETMANFNAAQEKARKDFAANTMARSKDEAREEESLLLEIKRILARTERFNEERRELYKRLDYPHTDQDISAYKSSAGLQSLLQNLMNIDKSKKRRSIAAVDANGQPMSASSDKDGRRESIAALSSHRDAQHQHHRGTSSTAAAAAAAAAAAGEQPASATASGGGNKKKGAAAQVERRKLSEQEEQVYGVSHHERLGSGPTFRYEKINKLYSHKSGQQQLRITNLLGELDIPPRLVMPTGAVTAQFETLWSAVTALVDLRKVSDKLDAEIKLEEAKKAEREKAKAVLSEEANDEMAATAAADPTTSAGEAGADSAASDKAAAEVATTNGSSAAQSDRGQDDGPAADSTAAPPNGTAPDSGPETSRPAAAAAVNGDGEPGDASAQKDKKEKGSRPENSGGSSSSAAHKRSASVLSTTSDKSTKRQRK